METVASRVAAREDERLIALALRPHVHVEGSVPIHLVEQVGCVDVSLRTVLLATSGASAAWPDHIVLIVVKAGSRVVARRKVDVGTKGGRISIAVHVREANASPLVGWVLDAHAVEAVGVCWIGRYVVIGAGAGPLDGLRYAIVRVCDGRAARRGWCARFGVSDDHAVAWLEGDDIVVGCLEEVVDIHVEDWNINEAAVRRVLKV